MGLCESKIESTEEINETITTNIPIAEVVLEEEESEIPVQFSKSLEKAAFRSSPEGLSTTELLLLILVLMALLKIFVSIFKVMHRKENEDLNGHQDVEKVGKSNEVWI